MKILVLGLNMFVDELRQLGHDIITCGSASFYDVVLPPESFSLDTIIAQLNGWQPDLCLFIETLGNRAFPDGLLHRPFPVVFYSIDTHLNYFWLRHFATACDVVITTQKDFLSDLRQFVPQAYWLPWSNDPQEYYDLEIERDIPISFVGAVDDFRPRRKALLSLIQSRYPIQVFAERLSSAEVNKIYSRSKIVVNEAIAGEVNFRIFEAMASGAMLLTDRIGNGLTDLFDDGHDLVTFGPEDVLERVGHYLANDVERKAIANQGKHTVRIQHSRAARAQQLIDILHKVPSVPSTRPSMLGKSYFLMLRRGLLSGSGVMSMTYRTLMEEASRCATGDCLVSLGGFFIAFADEEAGKLIYRQLVKAEMVPVSALYQWALLLLEERRDKEAEAVLHVLTQRLQGPVQASLLEALSEPFPSPQTFMVLTFIVESDVDTSTPGFLHFQGRNIPLSGSDVVRIGLLRHPEHAGILELSGDLSRKRHDPIQATDMYLRATSSNPCGRLLTKAAEALLAAFMLDEAFVAASTAFDVFRNSEGADLAAMLSRAMGCGKNKFPPQGVVLGVD